ncbi:hypothetical protein BDQ17DRAFT_1330578 [Cyathus striatus]|nr:hypothetical protein BDQ17DRAFT_1330578 [Cyathus striatus]
MYLEALTILTNYKKCSHDGNKKKGPAEHTEVSHKKVIYILTVYCAKELQKAAGKHTSKSSTLHLSTCKPWDTMRVQILARISDLLNLDMLTFRNYKITAMVPHVIGKPGIPLASDADYKVLIQQLLGNCNMDPLVNLLIEEMIHTNDSEVNKENSDESDKEKKKAKKAKRDPALLPGNVTKAEQILAIRAKWKCPNKMAQCIGGTCYIGPGFDGHFPMSHEQVDCWVSYSLKADPEGALDSPPNHHLFPREGTPSSRSPVLQRQLDAQNQDCVQPPSPTINFQIGNDFISLLRDSHPASHSNTPASSASDPFTSATPAPVPDDSLANKSAHILSISCTPGSTMPIKTFCSAYKLDDGILEKFVANGFRDTKHLRYLTHGNLMDMGFLLGEIAAVRDAVDAWSSM